LKKPDEMFRAPQRERTRVLLRSIMEADRLERAT
jgi:hypothetical protein